jgi:hypothetical protein
VHTTSAGVSLYQISRLVCSVECKYLPDGKRFTDDEDLQHAVMDWLNSQAAVWYEEGISKLVSRYDKCLSAQGDYVEK